MSRLNQKETILYSLYYTEAFNELVVPITLKRLTSLWCLFLHH